MNPEWVAEHWPVLLALMLVVFGYLMWRFR